MTGKIKFKKGIIQIPLLIGIIVSIVVIIGISYFVFIGDDYRSENQCKSDCLKKGFENGGCRWPEEMFGETESLEKTDSYYENVENIGSCVLTFTKYCGNEGQCNCYCFDVATQPIATITTTTTQPTATEDWSCGDSVTFTYKGSLVTYGTVKSQDKCWLDRNLGASQVATSHCDVLAYGDLFQWGRLDDGHQKRNSGITFELSDSDDLGHSSFILVDSSPHNWRDPQNDNLWQGVLGINNPCPSEWRIPTEAEWDIERVSWSEQNAGGAFISPLKLTVAGHRTFSSGSPYQSPQNVSYSGSYWSSTVFDVYASRLYFDLTAALFSDDSNSYFAFLGNAAISNHNYRALGSSVRCIKD